MSRYTLGVLGPKVKKLWLIKQTEQVSKYLKVVPKIPPLLFESPPPNPSIQITFLKVGNVVQVFSDITDYELTVTL